MMARQEPLWTIDQLGAQVSLALAVDYAGSPNGRVRDVPDRRTIRYYTTLGLLDRPAEMRGRTAYYGCRHLLQLVAIKRLQARGLALAEIQQHLLGLADSALRRLAKLPANLETQLAETGDSSSAPSPRSESFWREPPVPSHDSAGNGTASAESLVGISLDEEATLLLASVRPVYEEDLSAIRVAAAPLLKLLYQRRLLRPRAERTSHDPAAPNSH
jgi:DNA-binding transcriptional MerR regulator